MHKSRQSFEENKMTMNESEAVKSVYIADK